MYVLACDEFYRGGFSKSEIRDKNVQSKIYN